MLDWPPYSPDLNPIEYLWYRLKQKVYKVHPDIEQVGGDADKVRDALWDALEKAWYLIEEDQIGREYARRVAAYIKAEGWYTKY